MNEFEECRETILKTINTQIITPMFISCLNTGVIQNYFVGGSYRFGYCNENSDIDFFILLDSIKLKHFEAVFRQINITKSFSTDYPNVIHQYRALGTIVHFNIYFDPETYYSLEKEHEDIEIFLNKNRYLEEIIRKHKKDLMEISEKKTGSTFYRILKVLQKISK